MSTFGTQFTAWEPTIYLLDRLSVTNAFVFQLLDGHSDAGIVQTSSKVVVFNHASKVQVFDVNGVKSFHKVCGEFVDGILATIRDLLMDLRNRKLGFLATVRSFCLPGKSALKQCKALGMSRSIFRICNAFAIGKRCKPGNAEVNTNRFTRLFKVDIGNFHDKGNMVLTGRIPANYQAGRIGGEISGPFDFDGANLGKLQCSRGKIEGKCRFHVFSRLVAIFPFECGISGSLLKEVQERRLEMPQRLLEWHTGNIIQPRESGISLEFSKIFAGFWVSNSKAIFPALGTKIQTPVVYKPRATKGLSKQDFLLFGRVDSAVETKSHDLTKIKPTAKGCRHDPK